MRGKGEKHLAGLTSTRCVPECLGGNTRNGTCLAAFAKLETERSQKKKNSKCKKSRQSKNPFLSFTLEVGFLLSSLVKVNVFGSGPAAPRALSTSHRTFATSEQTWVSLTSGLPSKSATARASVAGACLLPVAEGDFRVAIRRGSGTRLFLFLRTYRTDPRFRCTRGVVSCDGFPPRSNLDRCRYNPVTSFAWPYRNSEARQPQPALGSQMRHF